MNQFLSEIQEKYTKILKSANLIGFLNRLAVSFNLTDSQPLDSNKWRGSNLGPLTNPNKYRQTFQDTLFLGVNSEIIHFFFIFLHARHQKIKICLSAWS